MPYNVRVSRENGYVTVHIAGELDIDTAPGLKDCFDRLVEQGDTMIRVNLRWLTFCDSTGISAFVHGYEVCRAAGGQLRIIGEQGPVARILDLTGVRSVLTAPGAEPVEPDAPDPIPVDTDARTPAEAPGTRSSTLRIEVDVRDDDPPGRSMVAAPSQDDVADALASLDGRRHTQLTVVDGSGAYLTVGGGNGRYHVFVGAYDQGDRRVLQNADARHDEQVALVIDGTATAYAAHDVVDLDTASAAVGEFLRSGRPDPDLQWRSA